MSLKLFNVFDREWKLNLFFWIILLTSMENLPGCSDSGGDSVGPFDKKELVNAYLSSDPHFDQLRTYDELAAELYDMSSRYEGVTVGPLVSGNGTGLLPANEALMNDIISTVEPLPGVRNSIERFGLSTQGRPIMALRAGNRDSGRKVMIISQLHGNEVTSTEAVMDFLHYMFTSGDSDVQHILDKTDMLFVVRANPDGGEPDPETCLMPGDITFMGRPFSDGTLDCALQRFNVDDTAGLQTLVPQDSGDLFGATGLGFDPNRYFYTLLDGPIYPVETQAIVYALKTFAPEFLLDLHNQNIKMRCEFNSDEEKALCEEGGAGIVIDGAIQSGPVVIQPLDSEIQDRSERMGAVLLSALNEYGAFGRFAQIGDTLPPLSRSSVDGATELGIVANWIEVKCNSEIVGFATIEEGATSFAMNLGLPFTPGDMDELVMLHRIGLKAYLLGVANELDRSTAEPSGYNTNPNWAPPNFDVFLLSDQLSDVLLDLGQISEPFTGERRVSIGEID